MIILGIDPGTATTGYGVVEVASNGPRLIECGVITTEATDDMPDRLKILSQDLSDIISKYQPEWMVVEQLFFATNAKTAIAVGQARGVILLCGAQAKLKIAEYTPLQVKQAITGYGQAKKPQIQQMVTKLLKLSTVPQPDDAADAVAIALTHCASLKFS